MSDGKELTYAEVAEHTSKKDLFVVIHDEVFDTSSFVDEHPCVPHSGELDEVKLANVCL